MFSPNSLGRLRGRELLAGHQPACGTRDSRAGLINFAATNEGPKKGQRQGGAGPIGWSLCALTAQFGPHRWDERARWRPNCLPEWPRATIWPQHSAGPNWAARKRARNAGRPLAHDWRRRGERARALCAFATLFRPPPQTSRPTGVDQLTSPPLADAWRAQ